MTPSSASWLRENADFTDEEEEEIRAGVKKLNGQVNADEPLPDPSTVTDGVFATPEDIDTAPQVMAEKTYLQAISDELRLEMRRDKRVFVIGEDVGVYGGAFKVTQGLSRGVPDSGA